MLGPGLALVSSLGWGTSDYLGGRLSRRCGTLRTLFASQVAAGGVLLVVALTVGGPLPGAAVQPGLLAGLAEAVAIASLYRGLAVGSAGLVAPASAISPAVPLLVALAAGDLPGPLRVGGLAMVVAGLVVASREPRGDARRPIDLRSLGYGLVSGAGFGTYFVLMADASASSVPWALVLARVTALGVLGTSLLVALVLVGRQEPLARGDLARLGLLGLLVVVGDGAYALSSTYGALVLVAVLAATHPVVTIGWARLHGREPIDGRRWVGIGVTVLGVVAVTA